MKDVAVLQETVAREPGEDVKDAGGGERQLREARKQGVSVTVVSQGIGDFLGPPSGRAVFQNAAAKLYLHQPAADLDAAARTLGGDPTVLREAAQLPRGHAILAMAGRTVQVQVQVPDSLHGLFRTEAEPSLSASAIGVRIARDAAAAT